MFVPRQLSLAPLFALIATTLAAPFVVHPGGISDIIINAQDTTNGTTIKNTTTPIHTPNTNLMNLAFQNNYAGSGSINAYVTGTDPNNNVVMLQADGQFYYPNANGATSPQPITADVAIPVGGQGTTTTVSLPDYIISARVWFAVGTLDFYVVSNGNGGTSLVEPSAVNPQDPSAGVNWGFVEMNYAADSGVFANISYVDFVGLVLGMILLTGSGSTQTVSGLNANAVSQICSTLQAQSNSDGQPWGDMCAYDSSGTALRVLSPNDYISVNSNAFSGYYSDYINQVWNQYTNEVLVIDTQTSAGEVNCQVSGGTLNCAGDNRGYAQPSEADIFGCNSGPFAILSSDNDIHRAVVPRLCAAFDRTTYLLNGGNVQPSLPSSDYYTVAPTNYYSAAVHAQEINGQGYAFSYDDVTPDGAPSAAGTVSDGNPQTLTVLVGGPN